MAVHLPTHIDQGYGNRMYIQMGGVGERRGQAKDMNAKSVAKSAMTEDIICLLLIQCF